jgi:hypothetical protein
MNAIDVRQPAPRRAAARQLHRAIQQLEQAEAASLCAGVCDEDRFERLIEDFCRAVQELEAESAAPALEATPRLRFAKWLFETGRISG